MEPFGRFSLSTLVVQIESPETASNQTGRGKEAADLLSFVFHPRKKTGAPVDTPNKEESKKRPAAKNKACGLQWSLITVRLVFISSGIRNEGVVKFGVESPIRDSDDFAWIRTRLVKRKKPGESGGCFQRSPFSAKPMGSGRLLVNLKLGPIPRPRSGGELSPAACWAASSPCKGFSIHQCQKAGLCGGSWHGNWDK